MLSYNSSVEVSVPSKPSTRLCLSIPAWHTGGASSWLVPGAGKCRKYTVGDAGVGENRATVGSQGGLHGEGVL